MAKYTKSQQKKLAMDMRGKAKKLFLIDMMNISDYQKISGVADKILRKLK